MGVADGVGLGLGVGVGVAETDGSGVGELDGTAVGTTATATTGGATLGPGVDQPPSGNDDRPPHAATHRISAGSSMRSERMAGQDWMRDSSGIATVDASRQEACQGRGADLTTRRRSTTSIT